MSFLSVPIAVDAVLKASVILGLSAGAAAALRRSSAAARHLVWALGLVSALAAPALSAVTPRWEVPIFRVPAAAPVAPSGASGTLVTPPARRSSIRPPESIDPSAMATSAVESAASAPAEPGATSRSRRFGVALPSPASGVFGTAVPTVSLTSLFVFAWAAGAAFILARVAVGLVAVRRMSRRLTTIADAPWMDHARALASTLGLTRVRFVGSETQSMPMAWGIFRPSVLMPSDADTWPRHRLRVVLLHELAHVQRRDCLTHVVAQIACAAYWFNPLAWIAARHLRSERERACDDLVLAAGTRGSDYASELLDIARVMRTERFPAVLAGASLAMAHRSELEGRLMAILDPSVPRRGLTRARACAVGLMFALLTVPVAAVQPWIAERLPATDPEQRGHESPSSASRPDRVVAPRPEQADSDSGRAATPQTIVREDVRGATRDAIGGEGHGGVEAGVHEGESRGIGLGVGIGVDHGIIGGVVAPAVAGALEGIADGLGGRIAGGVAEGIASGGAQGIAAGVGPGAQDASPAIAGGRQNRGDGGHDPRAVNALMEALKDTDKGVRETAIAALVRMRDSHAFEPLVTALKDGSPDVRQQAAFGLGQLHDARAIEPLTALLKDPSANVREQVVFALGQLRAKSAVDALAIALHDTADNVREQAAFALGQVRDPRGVDPLVSALKDAKPDVRQQAAFALGQLRDGRAVEALAIALKDTSADVREQAAFALGQIGDARAVEGLTAALKDANASVRRQAAFALGQIR